MASADSLIISITQNKKLVNNPATEHFAFCIVKNRALAGSDGSLGRVKINKYSFIRIGLVIR